MHITGSPVIDSIIDSKLTEAKNLGIKVNIKSYMHIDMIMDEFDLVTILGNILDNGISATMRLKKEDRYIYFSIKCRKEGTIIIEMHNTYDSNLKSH